MSPFAEVSPLAARSVPAYLLCGYYGENNLGDDALLTVLLREMPQPCRLLVTAHDADALAALAPDAEAVNRRSLHSVLRSIGRVNAVVLGGGSLLQDSTSLRSLIYYLVIIALARLRGRPVLLWGQGLGPLQRPISRRLVRLLLPACRSASWRDQASMDRASRWAPQLPMQIAPDPVWGLPPQSWTGGQSIVVCWRPSPLLGLQEWTVLLNALQGLAEELDAPIRWLAFHRHQDGGLLDWLSDQGVVSSDLRSRSTTVVPTSLEMVFASVRKARLVIPMRLHALILARLALCPMAALSYDPKVEAAAAMAGVPCTSLDALPDEQRLLSQWRAALDCPADPEQVERIRSGAALHGRQLRRFLPQR